MNHKEKAIQTVRNAFIVARKAGFTDAQIFEAGKDREIQSGVLSGSIDPDSSTIPDLSGGLDILSGKRRKKGE